MAIASLLIERGADINCRDDKGWTALQWACSYGYGYGHTSTALQNAYSENKKDTAILLVRKKANIFITDNEGNTPLDLAPEWRAELTELYEEVNRAWLARKAFLFVLIGCNLIESESNKSSASKQSQSGEGEGARGEKEALRDEVLRNVHRNIALFL